MAEFYGVCGEITPQESDKLTLTKAKAVFTALARHNEFKLIEIKIENQKDIKIEHLIVDVTADIIQYPKKDILYTERLCLSFYENDKFLPNVTALRKDFPRVIHTNLTPLDSPKSLCIYNENWHTVQLTWTAMNFLNRISYWLAQTSRDSLHFEDQPLEPLIVNPRYKVVIPLQLFDNSYNHLVYAESVYDSDNFGVLILKNVEVQNITKIKEDLAKKGFPLFYVLSLKGQPQQHGIISDIPNTLNELNQFLENAQIDLISELRTEIKNLYSNGNHILFENDLIISLIELPKTREKNNHHEASDYWIFGIGKIKDVGLDIGVLLGDSIQGITLSFSLQQEKNGENTFIQLFEPILDITPSISAEFNNIDSSYLKSNFAMIGAGALGSQILQNFVRMGYGQWTIIDNDNLLPHNITRHILKRNTIGFNKAYALACTLNNIFDITQVKHIEGDFLTLEINQLEQIKNVEAIVDVSTSLPVARKLALETEIDTRKLSVFVTPSGNDSVLLCEDDKKEITLDALEAQYYRAILNEPKLANHLQGNQGTIRYGGGCREISNRIPQDIIALHASILSKQIRHSLSINNAQISIWIANENSSVDFIAIPTSQTITENINDWYIIYDKNFIKKVTEIRAKKLPNETGGVLVGFFDTQRKRIYIVDTLESPSDSIETPWSYIRGREGLSEKINQVKNLTAHIVDFIADWHSHPDTVSVQPSTDDKLLLEHHANIMRDDGLPGIILIVGKSSQLNWIIKE